MRTLSCVVFAGFLIAVGLVLRYEGRAQLIAVSNTVSTATFTPGALLLGGCATQVTSVPGAVPGQLVVATPAVDLGAGAVWTAWVSSSGNITIRQCALLSITPTPTTFMVKVLQ